METNDNMNKSYSFSLFSILAVALIVFREPIITGTMPLHTDGQFMTFPAIAYFKSQALAGSYPVWWVAGTLAGNMADTGSLGPAWMVFTPLFLAFKLETAWFLMIFLMYLFAGWSMFFFLQRLLGNAFASLYGAILFMRGEWIVDCLAEPQIQFFLYPLILLLFESAINTRNIRYLVMNTVLLALFFLGSHLNYPLYLIPAAFFYFGVRLIQKYWNDKPAFSQMSIHGIFCGLFFISLVWFRVKILGMVSNESTRETLMALSPNILAIPSLLNGIFPGFFNHPSIPTPFFYDRSIQAVSIFLTANPIRLLEFWYPGLFAFFFILISFRKGLSRQWVFPISLLVLATLLYTLFGEVLFYGAMQKIPFLNKVVNTQRMSVVTTVGFPILGAYGLAIATTPENQSPILGWMRRIGYFLIAILVVLGVKTVFVYGLKLLGSNFLMKKIETFIISHPTYHQPISFYQDRVQEFLAWLNAIGNPISSIIWMPILWFAAGTILYQYWRRCKISNRLAGGLFLGMVILDSFVLNPLSFNTLVKRPEAYPMTEAIRFLQKDTSLYRFASLKDPSDPKFPFGRDQFLPADKQLVYGLSSAHSYQALTPKRYAEVYQLFAKTDKVDSIRLQDAYDYDAALANLLNVKYLVAPRGRSMPDLKSVYSDQKYNIFLNKTVLPRIFFVNKTITVQSPEASLALMKEGKINYRHTAILEGTQAPELDGPDLSEAEKVTMKLYGAHQIQIQAEVNQPRVLVLTDTYFSTWKCHLDGRPVPIYPANHAFRGILVPAGKHEILFYCEPFSYFWYTSIVIAILIFWLLISRILGQTRSYEIKL